MRIGILLGGPSMKRVMAPRGHDVLISANWSFLLPFVIKYCVVVDYRCAEKMAADDRFKAWVARGGICYFSDHAQQGNVYKGMITVSSTYPMFPQFGHRPGDGLYVRSHAGLTALSLACLLAPPEETEIDVYGLDLNSDTKDGSTANWHHEHDPKWAGHAKTSYPGMILATDEAKAKIPKEIRIRNMNPDSAYKGWELATR